MSKWRDATIVVATVYIGVIFILGMVHVVRDDWENPMVQCENCYQKFRFNQEVVVKENGTTYHYCPYCDYMIDWRDHGNDPSQFLNSTAKI